MQWLFFYFLSLMPQTLQAVKRVSPGDWMSSDDTMCSYEIHLHGTLSKVRATPSSVLFKSDNVLVINGEGGLRHLAFRDKGGGCHEQTRVVCHPKYASSFLSGPATKAVNSPDRCLSQPCNADAGEFALSLSRVMIAASLGPRPAAQNVAIVGLGGGMIPLWFQQERPQIHVDAIDISAGVVAAVHCFGVENGTQINVVNQDGRMFLQQQPQAKYDVVMVDAFDDKDNIPPCLRTMEFFKMVKSRLNDGGGLVINTWRKNLDIMLPALEQTFNVVVVCKSPGLGNIIVHATSSKVELPAPKVDHSFFGFKKKPSTSGSKNPAEWLADLEFIHPPKGWVLYPQYHQDLGSATTPPPPLTVTAKPLFTEYSPPEVETDGGNQCKYPAM
jgi:hypothetical protein